LGSSALRALRAISPRADSMALMRLTHSMMVPATAGLKGGAARPAARIAGTSASRPDRTASNAAVRSFLSAGFAVFENIGQGRLWS